MFIFVFAVIIEAVSNGSRDRMKRNTIAAAVLLCVVLALFGWMIYQNAKYAVREDTSFRSTVMLDGEYSIDGGDWKKIDNEKPLNEPFKKAVFKGKFIEPVEYCHEMFITGKNVWYTLSYADGTVLFTNKRVDRSEVMVESALRQEDRMLSTPGYSVSEHELDYDDAFHEGKEMILEVEYPYDDKPPEFSDSFYITMTFTDGLYLQFFFDAFPVILISLIVCFFGVFFFPIASVILGRFDAKYIAFGSLCFCSGLYLIMQRASEYLDLWIQDSTVCMMTDKLSFCFFAISVLYYLKSLMNGKAVRLISAGLCVLYIAATIAAVALHMTDTMDMQASSHPMSILFAAATIVMTVLLCVDIRGRKGMGLVSYLLSWTVLSLSGQLGLASLFINRGGMIFFCLGLAFTIVYQMVRFGIDLRRQYLEAIRYQQVQKELYEAKVSVMTSQIRPHFMYNALTSIAMMCTIEPKTAQEATITFAKYLRGNMDSLKQTAPVPFTQELEHLKKYLYIEKLRFDDLLNIEYDIQTTDFELPLLSIQPLVENAVKHGVGMKEDGGTVKISTRETDDAYEVIIEDDGVGFDVNEKKDDGKSHVGMENTKKRLRDMCGGEVIIESKIGEGTTAKVILPKEGQHNENSVS